jgi:hypothetical protein
MADLKSQNYSSITKLITCGFADEGIALKMVELRCYYGT